MQVCLHHSERNSSFRGVKVEYFRLCSQENISFVTVLIICLPIPFFFLAMLILTWQKKKENKN